MSVSLPTLLEGSDRFRTLQYLVRHRTAANLILLVMLVGGVLAAITIRSQFFPDVVFERVTVQVAWPGAGPDDIDRNIISRLEPPLRAVEGVEYVSATAVENSARIVLEFESGWDMGRALDEAKSVVDRVTDLPETSEQPEITRSAFRDRITEVVIYGPVSYDLLVRYAEDLQSRLFQDGVTRATLSGIPDQLVQVEVPQEQLIRHDLTLNEIAQAIAAESQTSPAGDLTGGIARIRTGTERQTAEQLLDLPVRSLANGDKLFLKDVGDIELELRDNTPLYFYQGKPAVMVRVDRSARDDAISLQGQVQTIVDAMQPEVTSGVQIRMTRTRAQAISDRLDILIKNGSYGLVLVLIFLFLFLSARTAFWVAVGIPAAMAATVGIMYASGFTLNMVSLFALIICLGIVVDDAIVVGEYADSLAQQGASPTQAASLAVVRMAPPVFCASITTIIAFSALVFVGGRFGTLIIDIPFTVCMVIIASLAESFLVLPAHMRHALSARNQTPWYDWPSRQVNRGFMWFRDRVFRPVFKWIITIRYPLLGAAILLLLLSVTAFMDGKVYWRFFNAPERGTISANIAMLPGATEADTRAMLDELQRALDVVNQRYEQEHGTAPVAFSLAILRGSSGRGLRGSSSKDRDLLGGFSIELIDPDLRPYSAFKFIGDWQDEVRRPPLLETLAVRGQRSGPGGDAIEIRLSGNSADALKEASLDIQSRLARFSAVSALEDSLAFDKPELELTLKPRGHALGFTSDQLGRLLSHRLRGIDVLEFPVNNRNATIRVTVPEAETRASFLDATRVRTVSGVYVPLGSLVEINEKPGFATIRREDGNRVITVSGDISEDDSGAAEEVTRALASEILPDIAGIHGVQWQLKGLAEQEKEFLSDALKGFGLCLLGIYLCLCWIFASWVRPVVIMAIIPFGIIGMIWGHYLHNVPISMFSVVGFIGMSGIIINDSIVLITTINSYNRHFALKTAILEATCQRLRPVFLTTATTVFGLAPLLLEQSRQAQFLKPTVITLVYGLGFGLFFVLLLTPALVMIQGDIGRNLKSLRRMLRYLFGGRRYRAQNA